MCNIAKFDHQICHKKGWLKWYTRIIVFTSIKHPFYWGFHKRHHVLYRVQCFVYLLKIVVASIRKTTVTKRESRYRRESGHSARVFLQCHKQRAHSNTIAQALCSKTRVYQLSETSVWNKFKTTINTVTWWWLKIGLKKYNFNITYILYVYVNFRTFCRTEHTFRSLGNDLTNTLILFQ